MRRVYRTLDDSARGHRAMAERDGDAYREGMADAMSLAARMVWNALEAPLVRRGHGEQSDPYQL